MTNGSYCYNYFYEEKIQVIRAGARRTQRVSRYIFSKSVVLNLKAHHLVGSLVHRVLSTAPTFLIQSVFDFACLLSSQIMLRADELGSYRRKGKCLCGSTLAIKRAAGKAGARMMERYALSQLLPL